MRCNIKFASLLQQQQSKMLFTIYLKIKFFSKIIFIKKIWGWQIIGHFPWRKLYTILISQSRQNRILPITFWRRIYILILGVSKFLSYILFWRFFKFQSSLSSKKVVASFGLITVLRFWSYYGDPLKIV
jgi:hypothetical protein